MSNLLLEIVGNPTLNRTIFPPHIYIYDDWVLYKKRRFFVVKEITMSYNHISHVILTAGIFFGKLEIYTTGAEDVIVKFIPLKPAHKAKRILDQKLYNAHAKLHPDKERSKDDIVSYEKSISRLRELEAKGRITSKEFQKRKKEVISKIK